LLSLRKRPFNERVNGQIKLPISALLFSKKTHLIIKTRIGSTPLTFQADKRMTFVMPEKHLEMVLNYGIIKT